MPSDLTPKNKKETKSLRELEKEIQAEIREGVYSARKYSVNALFDKFIDLKDELRQTTKVGYQELYDRYVRNSLGNRDVKRIKYSDIKAFYVLLKKEKGISGSTIKKLNCILSQAFDMAVKDDMLRKNPCEGVIKELSSTGNMKAKKKKALTLSQQKELLNFVKNSIYSYWMGIIVFLLGTGCRIGEAAGLRWRDVDFENNVIHIRNGISTVNKGYIHSLQKPKTDAGIRDIPMLYEVRKELACLFDAFAEVNRDGFVFLSKAGTVIDRNAFDRVLKRIVRDYNKVNELKGLSLPHDLSSHTFRHSFGTRMSENKVNVKVTQALMGHAKVITTLDIYTDTFDEEIHKSIGEVEGMMALGENQTDEDES